MLGYNKRMKTITYCNQTKISVKAGTSVKEILSEFDLKSENLAGVE